MENILINTQHLFISSKTRQSNETINDFSVILPPSLFSEIREDEYIEMELVSYNGRQSYYNISSNRNSKITFRQYDTVYGGSYTDYIMTIPDGNYDILELKTIIQTTLSTTSTTAGNAGVWVVTLDLKTLKFTFGYDLTASLVSFLPFDSLDEDDTSMSLYGFEQGEVNITPDKVSDILINIGNISSFFIYCNLMNNKSRYLDSGDSEHNHTSILCEVPIITNSFGSSITYTKTAEVEYKMFVPFSTSNLLRFTLKDHNNDQMEFTSNYNMSFQLKTYKKNNLTSAKMYEILTQLLVNTSGL